MIHPEHNAVLYPWAIWMLSRIYQHGELYKETCEIHVIQVSTFIVIMSNFIFLQKKKKAGKNSTNRLAGALWMDLNRFNRIV